jgi:hypothetical protein
VRVLLVPILVVFDVHPDVRVQPVVHNKFKYLGQVPPAPVRREVLVDRHLAHHTRQVVVLDDVREAQLGARLGEQFDPIGPPDHPHPPGEDLFDLHQGEGLLLDGELEGGLRTARFVVTPPTPTAPTAPTLVVLALAVVSVV